MYRKRYREIGLKISYYRKKTSLTQTKLAENAGISASYLGQIERGEATGVALSIYWRLADVLGVDFKCFLD